MILEYVPLESKRTFLEENLSRGMVIFLGLSGDVGHWHVVVLECGFFFIGKIVSVGV